MRARKTAVRRRSFCHIESRASNGRWARKGKMSWRAGDGAPGWDEEIGGQDPADDRSLAVAAEKHGSDRVGVPLERSAFRAGLRVSQLDRLEQKRGNRKGDVDPLFCSDLRLPPDADHEAVQRCGYHWS